MSEAKVTDNPSMILRKAGAALAAGCSMIVKPSPETPLSVLALAYLAEEAGFPKGVFSVLTTSLENTPPLSEALCKHPLVKKVTFTGSVSHPQHARRNDQLTYTSSDPHW